MVLGEEFSTLYFGIGFLGILSVTTLWLFSIYKIIVSKKSWVFSKRDSLFKHSRIFDHFVCHFLWRKGQSIWFWDLLLHLRFILFSSFWNLWIHFLSLHSCILFDIYLLNFSQLTVINVKIEGFFLLLFVWLNWRGGLNWLNLFFFKR